jgi:hypothetical protein
MCNTCRERWNTPLHLACSASAQRLLSFRLLVPFCFTRVAFISLMLLSSQVSRAETTNALDALTLHTPERTGRFTERSLNMH